MYQSKILTYQGEVEENNNDTKESDGNVNAKRNIDVRFEDVEQKCLMHNNIDVIVSKGRFYRFLLKPYAIDTSTNFLHIFFFCY